MISVYWALILAALGAMYLINPIHLSPHHGVLPLHPTNNNTVGKCGRPHQIASCCHCFPCLQSQGGSVWTWVRWGVIVLFLAMSVSLWIIDPPVDQVSPAGRPRNAKNTSLEGIGTRWPPWRKRGRQGHKNRNKRCKLLINVLLWNKKDQLCKHYIAFDGRVVYDKPLSARVNLTWDRHSKKSCDQVFHKLFPSCKCNRWQIVGVFEVNITYV